MPFEYFFIIWPIWFAPAIIGAFCFFLNAKFLSSYLILVPTGGALLSFVFLTIAIRSHFGDSAWMDISGPLFQLASLTVGGVTGCLAGFFTARAINRRFGWKVGFTVE